MPRLAAALLSLSTACTLYLPGDEDRDGPDGDCVGEPPPCLTCGDEMASGSICVDGDWVCPVAHCQPECAPADQGYFCVYGCGDDYSLAEECVGGRWQCPAGTRDGNECPAGTCWGLPPSCCVDGARYSPSCDQGSYVCTAEGSPEFGDCEVACPEEERPTCVQACDDEPLPPSCVGGELWPEDVWQCPAGTFDASECVADPA